MTPPYYTVTIANTTRGWSYASTHGDDPDPAVPVHLADLLELAWSFEDEQVPGQLNPMTLTFGLYARDADDLPIVDQGDTLTVDVRVGTLGARIAQPAPFTVTAADVDIDDELAVDPAAFAVTARIKATCDLAYLRATYPTPGPRTGADTTGADALQYRWRPQLAQLARQVGRSILAPTWWLDAQGPIWPTRPDGVSKFQGVSGLNLLPASWVNKNAHKIAADLLASHQPGGSGPAGPTGTTPGGSGGLTHTLVPGYRANTATLPTGYRRVGPNNAWGDGFSTNQPAQALSEPATSRYYACVPASRKTTDATLPVTFLNTVGVATLRVQPNPSSDYHYRGALDAAWIDLPLTLRRARGHRVDYVRVAGVQSRNDGTASGGTPQTEAATRDSADLASLAVRGVPTTRSVDTALWFGDVPVNPSASLDLTSAEGFYVGQTYLGDGSQDGTWVYDDLTLYASRISDALATAVLTSLTPRYPGETGGDGQVLRHFVVYNASARSRPVDQPSMIAGFAVAGRLRVTGGDIEVTLTLTPGMPVRIGAAPTPVTVGDAQTSNWGLVTVGNIDDRLVVGDLDLIDY